MTASVKNAPVRVGQAPGQAMKDAGTIYRTNTSFGVDSTTPKARCQYDTQRNFTICNAFQQAKERVSMMEAATFYGYTPNRAGFIRCPFHGGGNERTASCKLYENGWHCFGCQTGGTVIDFTARLFDLSPLDAVKKLNTDFSLGLSLDRHKATPEELETARKRQEERNAQRRFENWRKRAMWALSTAAGVGEAALRGKTPEQWTESEILAIRKMAYWDYLTECLSSGNESECVEILRDWPVIGADVAKAVSVNG